MLIYIFGVWLHLTYGVSWNTTAQVLKFIDVILNVVNTALDIIISRLNIYVYLCWGPECICALANCFCNSSTWFSSTASWAQLAFSTAFFISNKTWSKFFSIAGWFGLIDVWPDQYIYIYVVVIYNIVKAQVFIAIRKLQIIHLMS